MVAWQNWSAEKKMPLPTGQEYMGTQITPLSQMMLKEFFVIPHILKTFLSVNDILSQQVQYISCNFGGK